jgi:hypothetical protein
MTDVSRDRLDIALGVVGKFVDDAWVAATTTAWRTCCRARTASGRSG